MTVRGITVIESRRAEQHAADAQCEPFLELPSPPVVTILHDATPGHDSAEGGFRSDPA